MEKSILPIGKAHEPDEGARYPTIDSMSPHREHHSSQRFITFANDTDLSEKSASQKSYKDVLSQPAPSLSHRQKLMWLQKRRTSGLWVQCDDCDRWRYLPNVLDSYELPNKWYCRMNPDTSYADCSVPEMPIRVREEEDLIHSIFSAGSVVWARMTGWPWWPAMVDDCPDTEQFYWLDGFSDIPTQYNVVFFDSTEVTRGWIAPDNLKPYTIQNAFKPELKEKKYKTRLESATRQANDALKLPLVERLEKYSFIAKYKGNLYPPKKVTKKDLIRYQKKMKRRFNIEFPIEVSDEDSEPSQKSPLKKRNMIILGTPKRNNAKRIQDEISLNVVNTEAPVTNFTRNSMDTVDTTPAIPTKRDKAKKRIQDSMDIANTNTPVMPIVRENSQKHAHKTAATLLEGETESTADFKPNSMIVQVGSRTDTVPATESYIGKPATDTILATESYDNDTSKTYVPEFRQTLESTETEMGTQEFEGRAATPNSDDFDF